MKVLVCGSRTWTDAGAIRDRLSRLPRGTTIISGGARGADQLAATVARGLGFDVREYPADWPRYGRRAGYLRNIQMLEEGPDLVIAFWEHGSKGTAYTLAEAQNRGIPTEVIPPHLPSEVGTCNYRVALFTHGGLDERQTNERSVG